MVLPRHLHLAVCYLILQATDNLKPISSVSVVSLIDLELVQSGFNLLYVVHLDIWL